MIPNIKMILKNKLDFYKIKILWFKWHYQENEKTIKNMGDSIWKIKYPESIRNSYNPIIQRQTT